ncbi:hypothetical protein [Geobacter anodireducens]|uniref:Uncharacterized protein n=1 Tax=Geobacter soli TaxID=1510391 RepID=A0A0C1QWH8_9BACT|nr:hypothetical protein [Geobacter soli]KIE42486.1 hypothetical protein SE37_07495 [Geobacter soli]
MVQNEIVMTLSQKLSDPSEVVYAITMKDLVVAIAGRLREDALHLTAEELLLARDEVRETFGHYLDEREIFELALDQWDVVRQL